MQTLGYVKPTESTDNETTINFLMMKALEKVSFLPFGYLVDKYRWGLFDGSVPRQQMEREWLKLRNELQGIVPPVVRSEEDFDPGSKFHIPLNIPYLPYFVSWILQFQIHKELCTTAGEYPSKGPLYMCDIYGSKDAGSKFKLDSQSYYIITYLFCTQKVKPFETN